MSQVPPEVMGSIFSRQKSKGVASVVSAGMVKWTESIFATFAGGSVGVWSTLPSANFTTLVPELSGT